MSLITVFVLLFLALFIGYMVFAYRKIKNTPEVENSKNISNLTDTNFKSSIGKGIVLVDFWASWCMPCKMMAPVLNDLADEVSEIAKVAKVDVETNRNTAAAYSIRNIPTLILFKDGKEINRFVGAKTKAFLQNEINKVK